MSRYKDSHDALDSLVNYYVDCEDRKEAEKLIKQDLDKLEKIENLEEELNIDLLELLEDLKKTKEELKDILNEHLEITPDYMAYTLSNGITYRKLTEKLGCPLDVVFKALIDGVYIEVEHLPDIIERPRLYYSDDFKCYCLEMLYGEYVVKLKDYQKTWWLKGDNNE